MFKAGSEDTARDLAREHGLLYGMSVLDGKWYVGTAAQLTKIGVVEMLGGAP